MRPSSWWYFDVSSSTAAVSSSANAARSSADWKPIAVSIDIVGRRLPEAAASREGTDLAYGAAGEGNEVLRRVVVGRLVGIGARLRERGR